MTKRKRPWIACTISAEAHAAIMQRVADAGGDGRSLSRIVDEVLRRGLELPDVDLAMLYPVPARPFSPALDKLIRARCATVVAALDADTSEVPA